MRTRRTFTREFKRETACLVLDQGFRSGPHKLDIAISAPRGYAAILATYL